MRPQPSTRLPLRCGKCRRVLDRATLIPDLALIEWEGHQRATSESAKWRAHPDHKPRGSIVKLDASVDQDLSRWSYECRCGRRYTRTDDALTSLVNGVRRVGSAEIVLD